MIDIEVPEEPEYPEPTVEEVVRVRKGHEITYRVTRTINGNGITSAKWELIKIVKVDEPEVNIVKQLMEQGSI